MAIFLWNTLAERIAAVRRANPRSERIAVAVTIDGGQLVYGEFYYEHDSRDDVTQFGQAREQWIGPLRWKLEAEVATRLWRTYSTHQLTFGDTETQPYHGEAYVESARLDSGQPHYTVTFRGVGEVAKHRG